MIFAAMRNGFCSESSLCRFLNWSRGDLDPLAPQTRQIERRMMMRGEADATSIDARTIGAAFAKNGNRGPGFDTVRICAASAVVFHHSLAIKYNIVAVDWINAFSGGYTNLGFLSVSVFFVLSGFLVTPGLTRSGDVLEYLSRRFMRIMPLLFVVVATTALVIGPMVSDLPPNEYFTRRAPWLYFRNLVTWLSLHLPGVTDYDGGNTINGPMWTLHYEWLCYITLAVLQLLAVTRKRSVFLALWLLMTLAAALIYFRLVPTGPFRLLRLTELYSYFGAGSLIYLYRDKLPWSWPLMGATFCALLAALWLGIGVFAAPALIGYLVVGMGLARFPWQRHLAKADLSYGIYLTHSVAFLVIMHFLPVTEPIVLFVLGWSLACLTAILTWNFIESPALRHKDVPARLVRTIIGSRLAGLLKSGVAA
jgi:peptidoglycan/LPS O-acetylase OafA/YrhL